MKLIHLPAARQICKQRHQVRGVEMDNPIRAEILSPKACSCGPLIRHQDLIRKIGEVAIFAVDLKKDSPRLNPPA